MTSFIIGAVMGIVALLGLALASHAQDGMFYLFGLLLFLFGVLFDFALIHRHTGQPSGH